MRDQTLDSLHPGLVVIGGLNRAGKSTLMHVLRYLGYGIPRGGDLPPPTVEYGVEADVSYRDGLYSIRLSGHGAPSVARISQTGAVVDDAALLYHLDSFTYRQLFTITLEELQTIANLRAGEKRQLQSVLLGAGLKEVAMLPQFKREFDARANSIGATRGNPSVSQFKPFHQGILEGQAMKNRGLAHVKEYSEHLAQLKLIEKQLVKVAEELAELRQQVRRLDLVKAHFENYQAMERLTRELQHREGERWEVVPSPDQLERVNLLLASCTSTVADINEKEIVLGLNAQITASLAAKGPELAGLMAGVSGIKERLRQADDDERKYSELQRDLARRIREVNANWPTEDLQLINDLRTDNIERHRLEELVEKYTELQAEHKERRVQLDRLYAEQEQDQGELQALEKPGLKPGSYMAAVLGSALVGAVGAIFFNPMVVSLVSLAVILTLTAYFFTGSRRSELLERRRDRLVQRAAEIKVHEDALAEAKSGGETCFAQLQHYRSLLSLDEQVPFSRLPGYLEQAKGLQDRILDLDGLAAELNRSKESLDLSFRRYTAFLAELDPQDSVGFAGGGEDQWAFIFLALEQWQEKWMQAEKIEVLRHRLKTDREEIRKIMANCRYSAPGLALEDEAAAFVKAGSGAIEVAQLERELAELQREVLGSLASAAVREAFALAEGDDGLNVFRAHCAAYVSLEEAEQAHLSAVQQRDDREVKLEDLKNRKQGLSTQLKRLSSPRDVKEGHRKINSNRLGLQRLAEDYALYRIAAFLLEETEQNLLSGMTESIMAGAGKIFNRITGGEYAGIEPGKDLLEEDFQAVLVDQMDHQTIAMLSRGTREQLYLSVRLGRILDVQPALPVIIDDSMANFDGPHLEQSLGVLHELGQTHQVFVLTCHSRLVEKLAAQAGPVQFWKLEQGQFSLTGYQELTEHLGR